MARGNAEFVIKEAFQAPARRGYSYPLLTADHWADIETNTGVVRVDVDTAATQPTTHAVFPAWRYGLGDLQLEDWHIRATAGESEAVALASETLTDELTTLQEKASPTQDDLDREWELNDMLEKLATYAYWYEQRNAFGMGETSLYRACSAPNVPFTLRSNFTLQPDRPFTLFIHRAKPHEGQEACYLRIRFGCWMLELTQDQSVKLYRYKHGKYWDPATGTDDPEAGQWVTYNGWDWDRIALQEGAISDLEDNGRLKKAWRKLTDDEAAQVAATKQQIADLKASKQGLGQAEKLQLKALQDALYDDIADVQWQDAAESTFNRDLAFTIIPQPRGFVVIHNSVGKNYWVYEDKRVTANDDEETIIGATPLQVEGNGGAVWFNFAYIQPEQHTYIESKIIPTGQDIRGDLVPSWSKSDMPNATVGVTAVAAGTTGVPGYRWRVDFHTTGGYLAFVYNLTLDLVATPRDTSAETSLFSSNAAPEVAWEVGREYSLQRRGRAATLTLTFDKRAYPSLLRMYGKQVVCSENGKPWFTGVLQEPEVRELNPDMVEVEYRAYDRWHILRSDKIWAEVVGDGKALGDYVREVVRGAGFLDSEIVISGSATELVLPTAKPGELPVVRPSWGCERGSYLEQLLDGFGYHLEMWVDGRGVFHLEPEGTVTRDDLYFERTYSGHPGRRTMRDVQVHQDWADFANDVSVSGAVVRGKALSARHQDWASVHDTTASNYLGRWLTAEPKQNDMLRTEAQVAAACKWEWERRGHPKLMLEFETSHDETLEIGDRVRSSDGTLEIRDVRADDRSSGTMRVTAEVLT
jgi:hypothetical protein